MSKRYVVAVPKYISELVEAYYTAEYGKMKNPGTEEISAGGIHHLIVKRWDDVNTHSLFNTRKEANEFADRVSLMGYWQLGRNGCGCLQDKAVVLGITKSGVWTN